MSDTPSLQHNGRIYRRDKPLTHGALGNKTKNLYWLGLAQAMGTIHGLQIDLWIPIATQGNRGREHEPNAKLIRDGNSNGAYPPPPVSLTYDSPIV